MLNTDNFRTYFKYLKRIAVLTSTGFLLAFEYKQTCKAIQKIVNPAVLDREKQQPEYIYIDKPDYDSTDDYVSERPVVLNRIFKTFKHSLALKLLWLCQHGSKELRDMALTKLANLTNTKAWCCHTIAQAIDKDTAVLLARTHGADLRYFLPPPIHIRRAALLPDFMSYKFRDLIMMVEEINPHYCIKHFVRKYFINMQEHMEPLEADSVPCKPDSSSERDLCILCIDALYHHLLHFYVSKYEEDHSIQSLVKNNLIPLLAEAMLRYHGDTDFDLAILKVLTVLSVHTNLLADFFRNGMIGELSRLLRSSDIRLSSSAAVCLANLSGEQCYRPGLYLLHPIYRTAQQPFCDTLLVHGLRGGVFITWRQRDKLHINKPLSIHDVNVSDYEDDCNIKQKQTKSENIFSEPDLQNNIDDFYEFDDDTTLADFEVVLEDIPTATKREHLCEHNYLAKDKKIAITQGKEDKCHHTSCWPKDWLPKDCGNLRILGLNYFTSLSEWLESCPLETADFSSRAADLVLALIDAGVGNDKPVVWLAHSMGGLIVKKALVEASKSNMKQFKTIAENTKAVLFFSTPHRGSALASMPRPAAAVLWPSVDVKQLKENSPLLLDLHQDFVRFANIYSWETISFGETMPTLIGAFKVPLHLVAPHSSDLGRGVFYELPLDHLSICKPGTRQSMLYLTVLDVLRRTSSTNDDDNYFVMVWHRQILWSIRDKIKHLLEYLNLTQC